MKTATATIDTRHLVDTLASSEVVRIDHHVPILSVVLAQFGEQSQIIATDMNQELTLPVEADCQEPFTAAIYPPAAITALGNGSGKATIEMREKSASIATGPVRVHCPEDIETKEFPRILMGKEVTKLDISEECLFEAINSVRFAISTEETRYYLNGIFLTSVDSFLTLVATDGHRLARYQTEIAYSGPHTIVPSPTVATLSRLLRRNSDAKIELSIFSRNEPKAQLKKMTSNVAQIKDHTVYNLRISHSNWSLNSRTIDGTYPDWQRVVPKEKPTIQAEITQAQVSRLRRDFDWRHAIIDPDAGVLRLQDSYGACAVEMKVRGKGAAFCINAHYLRTMVSVIGDVALEGSGPDDPFIARPKNKRVFVVQMPMKLPDQKG